MTHRRFNYLLIFIISILLNLSILLAVSRAEDSRIIYYRGEVPNTIELLEARITELERQVKELQRLTKAPDGLIWCDNFGCYDSLGRQVDVGIWPTLKDQVTE